MQTWKWLIGAGFAVILVAACWYGYLNWWLGPADRFVPLHEDMSLVEVLQAKIHETPATDEPFELSAGSSGNVLTVELRTKSRLFVKTDSRGQAYTGFVGRGFRDRRNASEIARVAYEAEQLDPFFVLHFGPVHGRGWGEDIVSSPAIVKTSGDQQRVTLKFEVDAPETARDYRLNLVLWKPKAPRADATGGMELAGTIVWHHPVRVVSAEAAAAN